jgi:hypothetical protein
MILKAGVVVADRWDRVVEEHFLVDLGAVPLQWDFCQEALLARAALLRSLREW